MHNYAWSSNFEFLDVAHFDAVAVKCNLRQRCGEQDLKDEYIDALSETTYSLHYNHITINIHPLLLLIVALVIVYLALVIVALVIIVVALACWLKMDSYAWSSDFELLDVAHFDLVAVECNLR